MTGCAGQLWPMYSENALWPRWSVFWACCRSLKSWYGWRTDGRCMSAAEGELHVISKRYTQRIEQHNLNLRQHLARLGRKCCRSQNRWNCMKRSSGIIWTSNTIYKLEPPPLFHKYELSITEYIVDYFLICLINRRKLFPCKTNGNYQACLWIGTRKGVIQRPHRGGDLSPQGTELVLCCRYVAG